MEVISDKKGATLDSTIFLTREQKGEASMCLSFPVLINHCPLLDLHMCPIDTVYNKHNFTADMGCRTSVLTPHQLPNNIPLHSPHSLHAHRTNCVFHAWRSKQPTETLGSWPASCWFVATAPCKILQWRSAACLSSEGSYRHCHSHPPCRTDHFTSQSRKLL